MGGAAVQHVLTQRFSFSPRYSVFATSALGPQSLLKKCNDTKMFLGICRFYLCKKSICLVKIIMSKLHFANLSFDEKSSDTLCENEKYLRFCLININFFYINRIYRSQGTFWYFLICFKMAVDRAKWS